jgi:chromosome segregation ATPase
MSNTDIAVFSEEEQKEIIAQIEAAAQRGPIEPSRLPSKGEASKRSFFPLVVNVTAAALLCAGIFCMFFFQREGEVKIRESGAVLGITERKLIQEIRRETSRLIGEKEAAIEAMNGKIAEVDAELARLDSLEALTDEQRAAMSELHRQQDEYRVSLQGLQSERAQILAEARRREEDLNARIEEQRGAFENLSAQSRAEIQAAREELTKLSGEQEKSALVEKQLGAYFTAVGREIEAGQYREASETLAGLKEFLTTPSFRTLRSIQARRESDLAAVSALSALVAEALSPGRQAQAAGVAENAGPNAAAPAGSAARESGEAETALRQQAALAEKDRALTEQAALAAEKEKTLAAREQSLAELQKNMAELQTRNAANLQTITERERQLESLRAQNTAYAQTIDTQQKTIAALNAELEKR